jgi:hypothetical protein
LNKICNWNGYSILQDAGYNNVTYCQVVFWNELLEINSVQGTRVSEILGHCNMWIIDSGVGERWLRIR